MLTLLHDAILELPAAHPEALLPVLREQLGDPPGIGSATSPSNSNSTVANPRRARSRLRLDLGLELGRRGEATPFAALTIEVQLSKDENKPSVSL